METETPEDDDYADSDVRIMFALVNILAGSEINDVLTPQVREEIEQKTDRGKRLFWYFMALFNHMGLEMETSDEGMIISFNPPETLVVTRTQVMWNEGVSDREVEEGEEKCVSCWVNVARTKNSCGHVTYCKKCFDENFEATQNMTCPLCRAPFDKVEDIF
jgi:hypothetical protein